MAWLNSFTSGVPGRKLLSLKEFVETGKGRPHPYDMPVGL